ncbi:MAG: hypothetical protein ACI4R9_04865 [Kiritimatiellia bacterium]
MRTALPCLASVWALFVFLPLSAEAGVRRLFREPRFMRGDTNLVKIQPIDDASWIWHPDDLALSEGARSITHDAQKGDAPATVMVFEKTFEVKPDDGAFTIDVSADERFHLTLDGVFVACGPNRADVANWQYQTYEIRLPPGTHVFKAVVTRLGNHAPLAQLSYRGGFILKASGAFDSRLTTGRTAWSVGTYTGMRPAGSDNGVWGTGSQFEIAGRGPFAVAGEKPVEAVVVRQAIPRKNHRCWGAREPGWMLFPTQLPDQLRDKVAPGRIVAATHDAPWRGRHDYTEADTAAPEVAAFEALRAHGTALTVPAKTRLQVAWNLGRYICAYPVLKTAGGKGARISWTWTESARDAKTHVKGNRRQIVGKYLQGYGDTFKPDGAAGEFSAPWFRCGLWCRLDIETDDDPLTLTELAMFETRYPVEMESAFASPDDPSLQDIRRICARAMQMCCHEMLFDCPYYEQQMYPGDTRVQLLVLSALSRDDRMIKRAIEIYDLATRDDGLCPFNYPTRGTQEGFTYTLCYLAMFGDYAMNHDDRAWLKARLPGLRKSMAGCELYENAQGLLEKTPGWNFMDWATEWRDSAVPNSENGHALNSFVNLFWLLDMQSAAKTERALGNALQAQYWEAKATKLKEQIVATFWDAARGLIADTPVRTDAQGAIRPNTYSEHQQALALITDCLPPDKAEVCFRHLVEDGDLARTTVYFTYYLFEAYFKMGRADLFRRRLDLWRSYVARDVTTLLEAPDSGKNGQKESRSDCHAWGAHPIWFMQTGLAGITSAAPFFGEVRIAPQPGGLAEIAASHPHPQGWVRVALRFADGKATGTVETPVPGTFVYGTQNVVLKQGLNRL